MYQGASINSVSERLGHSDIQTTQDHYAHVLKEMKERDEKIAVNMFKRYKKKLCNFCVMTFKYSIESNRKPQKEKTLKTFIYQGFKAFLSLHKIH